MLKILVKKQMAEIFRMYLYNAKKNKARSRISTLGMFGLFVLIMVGLLGGMFGGVAWAIHPVIDADLGWLYFDILGMIAIVLGAFGSVFNTFSGLYLAKDNDLLLAMPIPVGSLMASRLLTVYLMGMMYATTVALPTVIVYFLSADLTLIRILGVFVWFVVITVVVLVLSRLLGYVVARLSVKLRHKNIATVVISILFIGGYYFFYFKASSMLRTLLENAELYGAAVKEKAYGLYLFGAMPTGSLSAMGICLLVCAALLAGTWIVLSRSFLGIVTSTGKTTRVVYREHTVKQKSLFGAMLGKEFARFTGSANYMLNCGLGILFLPVMGIALLIKGSWMDQMIGDVFGSSFGATAVLLCGMISLLSSMIDLVAPSPALEGKNLWIAQSLPIPAKTVISVKLVLQLLLAGVPVLFCTICAMIAFHMSAAERVLVLVITCLFVCLYDLFGLFMGLCNPNLKWTSEIYPIKQSLAVMITLFSGWIYGIAMIGIYLWIGYQLGSVVYLTIVLAVTIVLLVPLMIWMVKKAPGQFELLGQ